MELIMAVLYLKLKLSHKLDPDRDPRQGLILTSMSSPPRFTDNSHILSMANILQSVGAHQLSYQQRQWPSHTPVANLL